MNIWGSKVSSVIKELGSGLIDLDFDVQGKLLIFIYKVFLRFLINIKVKYLLLLKHSNISIRVFFTFFKWGSPIDRFKFFDSLMRNALESLSELNLVRILILLDLFRTFADMISGLLPDVTVPGIVHDLDSSGLRLVDIELIDILVWGRLNRDFEAELRVLLRKVVELPEYRVHRQRQLLWFLLQIALLSNSHIKVLLQR